MMSVCIIYVKGGNGRFRPQRDVVWAKTYDLVSVCSLERGLRDKGRRTEGGQEEVYCVETGVFAHSVMWCV